MRSLNAILLVVVQFILFATITSAQASPKKNDIISLSEKGNGLISLNSNTYDRFTEGKRDYGLVVVLTALGSQFKCVPCREFDPEFELVAKSLQKNKQKNELFMGRLDFMDGQQVFQRLQIMSAPNVLYFPPQKAGEHKDFIRYDLNQHGFSAEKLAEFLTNETGIKVSVSRPMDYMKLAVKTFLCIGAAAILKLIYRHFGFIFYHRNTWAVISIAIVLTMTSGYMWNRIRSPPYIMPGRNGDISYVAAGFSNQLGIESQIVTGIYGILAFCIFALIKTVPKFENQTRQRFGVYIWMACFIFVFSALFSFFKIKNGGYPFKLLI
ncbi:hypothetical protein BDF20DRAFT_121338 [Mycotypha africana]|uniref:uncharacterized protein n=1 Tax=Mycotypha africana TaxID=64632 RepID=UPI0023017763|nr:uncharacterized protein BDF20DRAFT_121338 [Mycotypha africana]KAI8970368.1 hypothetical protein BDF20DRAFT_121338 [Mycotypha africana]